MEPWKLGAIVLLLAGFVGYGVLSNSASDITGPKPEETPAPSKFEGKTLPAWPTVKQWANTPAPVNLSALKGKPVLLEVFRINCSHCQEAAPFLVRLHARYAPRGVQFVGIQSPDVLVDPKTLVARVDPDNPEGKWKPVQSWLKQQSYTWPVGFDDKSTWFYGQFARDASYPSVFLLDADGKVIYFHHGHTPRKIVELGIQLEKIASGKGDAQQRAKELSRFLAPSVPMPGEQLAGIITERLSAGN